MGQHAKQQVSPSCRIELIHPRLGISAGRFDLRALFDKLMVSGPKAHIIRLFRALNWSIGLGPDASSEDRGKVAR